MVGHVEFTLEQTEILDASTAAKGLEALAAHPNSKLKKLEDEAKKRGYQAKQGPNAEMGFRQKFRAANPVKPKANKGEKGKPVQDLEFAFSLRELQKANSKDLAAVATVTVTAGENTEQYEMLLEAPAGNFAEAREFMVDTNNQVVAANSWWSATRSCAISSCGSVCLSAVLTCTGTWVAYFLCVAARCGGCLVRCAACAGCDCRWWCRWATGCCDA